MDTSRASPPAIATALLLALPASATDSPLVLVSPGGDRVALAALRAAQELTVLVFWSSGCPCVRRYQERADALLDAWPGRVRVIGVSSNAGEAHEGALAAARQRGVRLPIYRDEGGRVAAAVGARSTPTVAVLDRAGEVRFLGWVDNERAPGERGRKPWLEQAVEALLAGGRAAPERTPVYGCAITRSLFEPGPPGGCCSLAPAAPEEKR